MTGTKTGGRQAGTPNKTTAELREKLKNILSAEIDNMPELLSRLDDKQKSELLLKLLPYVFPKVEAVPMQAGEPLTW